MLREGRVSTRAPTAALVRWTLTGHRRALIFWTTGLVALVVLELGLWPSVHSQAKDLNRLLESYPETFKAFFGISSTTSFGTPVGYLQTELFGFMVPLLLLIFAISQGAKATAGEERDGTLDVLLATPIARRRVLVEKFAAAAAMVAALVATVFASILVLARAVGLSVGTFALAQALVRAGALALAFCALALFVGAVTGQRGTALGLSSAIAVAAFMIDSLGKLVSGLGPIRPLSPFYLYAQGGPLTGGLQPLHTAVLAGLVVVFVALATACFDRRDIAT